MKVWARYQDYYGNYKVVNMEDAVLAVNSDWYIFSHRYLGVIVHFSDKPRIDIIDDVGTTSRPWDEVDLEIDGKWMGNVKDVEKMVRAYYE